MGPGRGTFLAGACIERCFCLRLYFKSSTCTFASLYSRSATQDTSYTIQPSTSMAASVSERPTVTRFTLTSSADAQGAGARARESEQRHSHYSRPLKRQG